MGLNRFHLILLTSFYSLLLLVGITTTQTEWYKLAFWVCLGVLYRMNRVYEKHIRHSDDTEQKRAA